SSSDSEEKLAVKPLSLSKRKLDLDVEKKKKGRPRKDSRLMPVTLTVQSPAILASEKDGVCHSTPLALKLPTPVLQKSFALQVSSDPSMYIEVENEITTVGGSKLSRLKCNREGKEWETLLTSRILSAAGSCEVVSVACEKRTLSVFSACGRRLLPPIVLHSPISTLHCTGFYIMALTTAATLSVWNVRKQTVVVKDESLQTILAGSETTVSQILLTQHGIPLMNMSDGKAYCFNPSLSSWNLVSDKQEMLAQCADFRSSLPSQEAMLCSGPLAIIQGRMSKYDLVSSRSSSPPLATGPSERAKLLTTKSL
ncbi:protein HIRA-like, partial [Protobothrops mucrosquamatus]|uniref:protein HIRA-like n=1 Tax=Protobothrops mucrosquamatus TaxID=103944 RepID=UPI000775E209